MAAEKTRPWKREEMVKQQARKRSWPPNLGLDSVHLVEPLLRVGCSRSPCRWKLSLPPAYQESIKEHRENGKLGADLDHFEKRELEKY